MYPNSFRSQALFTVRPDAGPHAVILIYDTTGRNAGTLFDGFMQENDEQSIPFISSNLGSGSCFICVDGELFSHGPGAFIIC